MDITDVVDSIKGFVGSAFLGLHHEDSLCHYIFTGIRVSKTRSKDDILFIG